MRNQNILVDDSTRKKWKLHWYHGIIKDMETEGIAHRNVISLAYRSGWCPAAVVPKITAFVLNPTTK